MKTKVHVPFVDDDKNIVLRTDVIYTPEEFLLCNAAIFSFAESMKQISRSKDKKIITISSDFSLLENDAHKN